MEKNNKSHKKSSSSYKISLGESTKHSHHNKGSDSSSSSDDECKKKSKKRCCKKGPTGPPGPLVTTLMGSPEFDGLEPGYQSTYCISQNCNNKYFSVGCYITIHCTSEFTPYFLIIEIPDENVIIIQNVNEYTATWECGAKVALVGPQGPVGATGATLFDVAPLASVSWPYGATLIDNDGFISLELAPADNVNPGLLTATDQLISGTKYFQDVFVAANFAGDPYSSWGGFDPGSIYFDTSFNALQLYLGSTWATITTGSTCGCSGGAGATGATGATGAGLNGVTSLSSSGFVNGATLTSDGYLQFAYSISNGTTNTPGLMPSSYSDIFSTQGFDSSTNYGQNWIQTINYAKNWSAISMSSSGQYQTACENDSGGSLFVSTDYGNNWTQLSSTIGYQWLNVSISSTGQYQSAIAYDGTAYYIYVSTDYGASWSENFDYTPKLTGISVSASGQYQTACAENSGAIRISNDYGLSWILASNTSGYEWKCVSISASGQYQTACIYNGSTNYIYTSSNYGKYWSLNEYEPGNGIVSSVSLSASGQYQSICTSLGGRIYISNDYGNTWDTSDGSPTNANLVSISVSASGQYQVVAQYATGSPSGYTGSIFTSTDYGNNWSSINNAPNDMDLAPWSGVAISASGQYIAGVLYEYYIWNCQNSISNGVVSVGNYSTTSGVTGVAGSIYYDTDDTVLKYSDGSSWTSVKSFVIDHPKDQEKLLVHGCLEGPEAGVYYRGKGVITNNESVVIEMPDYVDKLATNLTVQLTPIYDGNIYKPQYFATEVSANKFLVHGVNGAFYWTVYGQRLSFIVEPNKTEVEIKGDGPYKWL